MSVCGIIAEYNPFHNGHKLHIKRAKEITGAENVVVVMSGNFVQRGEPAICDKYSRTKMALLNGADVVIELPVYFATASAEFFARAAVNILDRSGIVDYLCFGSESGGLPELSKVSDILSAEPVEFQNHLKIGLKKGLSYPVARSNAVKATTGDFSISNEPNDILAVEYLKALKTLNSKIKPIVIKRETAHYHSKDLSSAISSATAIRHAILNSSQAYGKSLPDSCFTILENEISTRNAPNCLDNYTQILQFILRSTPPEQLKQIMDISEGMENRIISCSQGVDSISGMIQNIKTKRYTFTRLQRALLHIILDIRVADFKRIMRHNGAKYIRVLGFRKDKAHLITDMRKKSDITVIMNLKNADLDSGSMEMIAKEIVSTDIYYLGLGNYKGKGYEYKIPLCIV